MVKFITQFQIFYQIIINFFCLFFSCFLQNESDAKSDEFSREPSFQWTMSSVDSNMFSVAGELYGSQIRSQLWTAINAEIIPQDCEIYR